MMMREKLLKWFGMLFAAMLLFTFLSRAADSVNVARVRVKTVQNQIVTHRVDGTGKIEGTREHGVFAREGQRISQVLVQEGQSVKKGEVLLKLSEDTLKETIRQKRAELDTLTRKVEDLKSQESVDGEKKSNALSRAEEDYRIAVENGDINIANAEMEADVSRQKLQYYFEAVANGKKADSSTEQALRDEIRAKDETVNQVIMNRNQEVLQAERAVEDAKLHTASDGSLANAEQELEQAQKEVKKLKKLLKAGGAVTAPVDGVVKSIAAGTGSQTTEEAAAVLYETAGVLRMTGSIHKDDLKYVGIGAKASLKGSSGAEVENAVIEAIQEDAEDPDRRIISVSVPENAMTIGETVEFTVSKDAGPYKCCVPLSAVYESSGQAFVYVLDSRDSVLGEVAVARKVEVSVQDKNNTTAALMDGTLSGDQKIVTEADREITDGSRVRLQES